MKRGTPRHPKTYDLAARLKIEHAHAVGILEMLWEMTADLCPSGDIGRLPASAIAQGVGWRKRPALLLQALIDAKWLDQVDGVGVIIHDWAQHCETEVCRKLLRNSKDFLPHYGMTVKERLSKRKQSFVDSEEDSSDSPVGSSRDSHASRGALAKATVEASAPLDISNSETTSSRARDEDELDLEDSVEVFMENSARRTGLRARVKLGKREWERQAERARALERSNEPVPFRSAWQAFLEHLRTAPEIEHAVAYFLASVDRWIPDAPARPVRSPAGTPTEPVPIVTVQPETAVALRDESLDAYVEIPRRAGKAIGEKEIEEARPLWVPLSDEQRRISAQDYLRICLETKDPKYIPAPKNHLLQKPWTRKVLPRSLPVISKTESKSEQIRREMREIHYRKYPEQRPVAQ